MKTESQPTDAAILKEKIAALQHAFDDLNRTAYDLHHGRPFYTPAFHFVLFLEDGLQAHFNRFMREVRDAAKTCFKEK